MVSYTFIHPGKPQVKQRPRMGRNGRVYTPKATLEAEEELRADYEGPLFEGPIALNMSFWPDRTEITITEGVVQAPLRGDIDNYSKLVLDGLEGVAYPNDRQVMVITAAKCA